MCCGSRRSSVRGRARARSASNRGLRHQPDRLEVPYRRDPRPIDGFQIPHHDGAGVIDEVGEGVDPGVPGSGSGSGWPPPGGAGGRPRSGPWCRNGRPSGSPTDIGRARREPRRAGHDAHRCLFSDGPLDGKTVLVAGGAGAVGHFVIELAKLAGATVITTVSGPAKAELATRQAPTMSSTTGMLMPRTRSAPRAAGRPGDRAGARREPAARPGRQPPARARCHVRRRACGSRAAGPRLHDGQRDAQVPAAVRDSAGGLRSRRARHHHGADRRRVTGLPVTRFTLDDVAAAQDAVEAGALGKVLIDLP